jgi:hypothetical protein
VATAASSTARRMTRLAGRQGAEVLKLLNCPPRCF